MNPDIYTRITDTIVHAIETGQAKGKDWRMPWHHGAGAMAAPRNATTGKAYRGVNNLMLTCTALQRSYATPQWATYKQWAGAGAQVRKGERGTPIAIWKDRLVDDDEGERNRRAVMVMTAYVFNAAQVDGAAPIEPAGPRAEHERDARCEAFVRATRAAISEGGNRAYYRPSTDQVVVPALKDFTSAETYYATLLHELGHWTGAEQRCAREFGKRFGDAQYAAEELVAELTASFLCADLDLSNEPRPDHAQYIASWLEVLRNDKRAIFTAASKAQQAADYLHSLQPKAAPAEPAPEPAPARKPMVVVDNTIVDPALVVMPVARRRVTRRIERARDTIEAAFGSGEVMRWTIARHPKDDAAASLEIGRRLSLLCRARELDSSLAWQARADGRLIKCTPFAAIARAAADLRSCRLVGPRLHAMPEAAD